MFVCKKALKNIIFAAWIPLQYAWLEGLEYVIIFAHRKFVRKHDGREQLIESSVNVSQI